MEALSGLPPAPFGVSIRLAIDDESQIGAARRSAAALGRTLKMSDEATGRLTIVVTEAATNILRHAQRGIIVLRGLLSDPVCGVEMLALDKGPGIPDFRRAMRDGYSTIGTAGQGLGGMQRLADVFEIYSRHEAGTAVLARIGDGSRPANRKPPSSFASRVGAVCVPFRGETACGDAWHIAVSPHRVSLLIVDGLGHGPQADAVAAIALRGAARLTSGLPEAALAGFDASMRGTRGAALSIAVIDEKARTARFSGVGNVDGRILSNGTTQHLVPQSGIVGHTMPTVRAQDATWPAGARLIMHSDGVSARWRLDAYPGLAAAHPALIAGVLYRDFARDRDDATVVVLGDRTVEGGN
jgi:anti-sigma regulatory factor (Ser/Thr protein kinase)